MLKKWTALLIKLMGGMKLQCKSALCDTCMYLKSGKRSQQSNCSTHLIYISSMCWNFTITRVLDQLRAEALKCDHRSDIENRFTCRSCLFTHHNNTLYLLVQRHFLNIDILITKQFGNQKVTKYTAWTLPHNKARVSSV